MSRRYDTRTTIFSPEGRLYQVEYAMEAIGQAGTCLGIRAPDGIFIAAQKLATHKLLDDQIMNEKIYKVAENIYCTVAGITSDANVLIDKLREMAVANTLQYGENISVEQLVVRLCDVKQHYTQIGGLLGFPRGTKWQAALRSVAFVRRMGLSPRLSAVSVGPQRKLRRLEGHVHREGPSERNFDAQTRIQGRGNDAGQGKGSGDEGAFQDDGRQNRGGQVGDGRAHARPGTARVAHV